MIVASINSLVDVNLWFEAAKPNEPFFYLSKIRYVNPQIWLNLSKKTRQFLSFGSNGPEKGAHGWGWSVQFTVLRVDFSMARGDFLGAFAWTDGYCYDDKSIGIVNTHDAVKPCSISSDSNLELSIAQRWLWSWSERVAVVIAAKAAIRATIPERRPQLRPAVPSVRRFCKTK